MLTQRLIDNQTAIQDFITHLDGLAGEPVRQQVFAKDSHDTLDKVAYALAQEIDASETSIKPVIVNALAALLNEPSDLLGDLRWKATHVFNQLEEMRALTRSPSGSDRVISACSWAVNLGQAYTILDEFTDTHLIQLT